MTRSAISSINNLALVDRSEGGEAPSRCFQHRRQNKQNRIECESSRTRIGYELHLYVFSRNRAISMHTISRNDRRASFSFPIERHKNRFYALLHRGAALSSVYSPFPFLSIPLTDGSLSVTRCLRSLDFDLRDRVIGASIVRETLEDLATPSFSYTY